MEDTKYNIGELIERRIRKMTHPLAEAAADAMHAKLAGEIRALGLDHFTAPLDHFVREIRDLYREKLVQDRLTGAIDGLINVAPSTTETAQEHATIKPPAVEQQVLNIKAGDTLVISTDRHVGNEQHDKMVAYIKSGLPDGVKVLVLGPGLKISTLHATDDLLTEIKALREEVRQMRDDATRQQGAIICGSTYAGHVPPRPIPQPDLL